MEKNVENRLLKAIEDYYLPKNLVKAIYERGGIPTQSFQAKVGIGFIDIADYTFLSKFLSPMENQTLLNGLYTAFQLVLERHGGYLNKIEGDSMMFQFDGVIDPTLQDSETEEVQRHIVKELFFTCVEMQRICVLFNNANEAFLLRDISEQAKKPLLDAFNIIKTLRERSDLASSMNAFFQIRIRIGASLGEVTLGNFGPDGAKQWDVIGMPVIDARRMEATSPVGGLRISEDYFHLLNKMGIVKDYCDRFRREAFALGSVYKTILNEEIFAFKKVTIQEKKGVVYATYSVQVNPGLPETIGRQVMSLIDHGEAGTDRAVDLIQYYRGNRYVIDHLEALFLKKKIRLRKADLLKLVSPRRTEELKKAGNLSDADLETYAQTNYTLFKLLHLLNHYQDVLKRHREPAPRLDFLAYDQALDAQRRSILSAYGKHKTQLLKRAWFYEVVVPLFYFHLKASILEFQNSQEQTELLEI